MVWILQTIRLTNEDIQVITKKANTTTQDNPKAPAKYKNTRYFREPLFTISNSLTREKLVVIGAISPEQAIEFANLLRHEREIALPSKIEAEFLNAGPISNVAYYSSSYFQYLSSLLDQLDNNELVCPTCGR